MINLVLDDRRGTVAPQMFSTLIEKYGTLLDGIWVGRDSDIANQDGLRLDTIEAFGELGMALVRFPGGTPADYYRWRDGIGPPDKRARTWNYFFGGEDANEFGTDEFLRFCEAVGATGCIKLNPITAPLHEALDWMQYCNYDGNTDLANERKANGHPAPYGVTHWIIGNETSDTYMPEKYADLVFQWTFYMRQVDPQAKIIATAGKMDWNERFLKRFAEISRDGGIASHNYTRASAAGIRIQPGWKFHMLGLNYADEETILRAIDGIERYFGPNTIELCVEEWEGQTEFTCGWPKEWRRTMSVYEMVIQQGRVTHLSYENDSRLDGAVIAAEKMHLYMRYATYVKMTSFLYPTNTWSPLIKTSGAKFVRTPHFYALKMLHAHVGGEVLAVEADGLDVMASVARNDERVTVSLLNPDPTKAVDAVVNLDGANGKVPQSALAQVLTGDGADQNTFEQPDKVVPKAGKVEISDGKMKVSCPPTSMTVVHCDLVQG